jgi:hypothetical protein
LRLFSEIRSYREIRPLSIFWWTTLAAWLVNTVVMQVRAHALHLLEPYNSAYFPQYGKTWLFVDFFDFSRRFKLYHQLDFFSASKAFGPRFSYPPPMGMLYKLFFLPPTHEHAISAISSGIPLVVLAVLLIQAMRRRGVDLWHAVLFVGGAAVFSYPFRFNYFLGNLEIFVVLFAAFGVVALLRGRLYLAATLIGIAGSMKLFPFVLLGLFLSRRQYRPILLSGAVAACTTLFATWLECPSLKVAREGISAGAAAMRTGMLIHFQPMEIGFDQSIFGLYKRVVHAITHQVSYPDVSLTIYMALAATGGILLYFLRIQKLPFINQVLCLYVAAVLLPPMSHHYTLMHLYVPWALLVLYALDLRNANRRGADGANGSRTVPGLTAAFVCLGLLFAPEAEFLHLTLQFSGPIKCLTLLALWYIALRYPFASARDLMSATGATDKVMHTSRLGAAGAMA